VLCCPACKGPKLKIGTADRTPRETLEERLEKTLSNARCFAQGSSLVCCSILENIMGIAHSAEVLGMCPHGLACPGRSLGPLHRVLPRILAIFGKIQTNNGRQKIFYKAHNFVPWWNFDKRFVASKAWDAEDVDRGIARVNRATHARAICTYLRCHFLAEDL
jgi:hypothetical protein